MAADIALSAIPRAKRPLTVLDPMAGSGTTLEHALQKGHRAVGVDCDPLAVLISRVRCRAGNPKTILSAAMQATARARKILSRRRLKYPRHFDGETLSFVRFWFDQKARTQLSALAAAIGLEKRKSAREALWCSFSRMIIVKSVGVSRAADVAHSRPHKHYQVAPVMPLEAFERHVGRVISNMCVIRNKRTFQVLGGDARKLPMRTGSVDLVITSPPYLNAIDYIRGHRLSLVWMGWTVSQLREIRSDSIGCERYIARHSLDLGLLRQILGSKTVSRLPRRRLRILQTYADDMQRVISEVARVLKHSGVATFVVGNSSLRGVFVANSKLVERFAAAAKLRLTRRIRRPLLAKRRYLPIPPSGNPLGSRMREETILTFTKA